MRSRFISALSVLGATVACASDPRGALPAAAGGAGAPSTLEAGAGSLGGSGAGAAGSPVPVGGAPAQPGSAGNADHGDLFDMAVPLANAGGPPLATGGGGSGGAGSLGDGNMAIAHFMGGINGTAVFTQHGDEVTLQVSLGNCSAGDHRLFIGSGDSCDSAGTQGNIWDGQRGDGLDGPILIKCADNKGALTYVRPGTDSATKWTIADHVFGTDVTNRVVLLSDPGNIANNRTCANFF